MNRSSDAVSRLITVSVWGSVVWGVGALALGIVLGSQTIIFDGLYSFVTLALSLVSLGAAHAIRRGPNERYPFGRQAFEPMANIVKAVGLGALSVYAIAMAALAIADGGNEVNYAWGLGYAVVVTASAGAVTLYLHRRQRSLGSGLVGGEITKWMIDAGTTGGIAVAFAIGWALQQTGNSQAAAYVDPTVVILFSVLALALPLRMGVHSFRELVLVSPPQSVADDVRHRVSGAERRHQFTESFVRMGKVGGQLNVEVYFVVGDATPARGVEDYDEIRRELEESIDELGYDQWLTVCFTANRTFALD